VAGFGCPLTGDLNPLTLPDYLDKILQFAKMHKCKRFLNDLRNAKINFTMAELYEASKLVITEEFDRSWVRAILVKEENLDKANFYETVLRNKGVKVKVFTNIYKAKRWLVTS
jgi:hypothetical protein